MEWSEYGAGDRVRTRDINLGKVALYQLSYSRVVDSSILSRHRHGCQFHAIVMPKPQCLAFVFIGSNLFVSN